MVFAVRTPHPTRYFDGLPDLPLTGLDDEAARALLARVVQGRMDIRIRDRIIAETRGNPLGAAGTAAADERSRAGRRLRAADPGRSAQSYPGPVRAARRGVAESNPATDPAGRGRPGRRRDTDLAGGAQAQDRERRARTQHRTRNCWRSEPRFDSAIRWCDPPSTGLRPLPERRRAHEALASVSDPELDADRRAWHRALATPGLDEKVAAALELSAGRAQTRGGLASAAAFLERAAALTADPAERARRALAAAQAHHAAGAPEAALALLATRARRDRWHRCSAPRRRFSAPKSRSPRIVAAMLPHSCSRRPDSWRRSTSVLARETYLDALTAAQFAGQLIPGVVRQVAEAARAAPPSPSPRAPDLLLDGLAVMIIEGHGAAAPLLQAGSSRVP